MNSPPIITQDFCFCSNDLKRRIVILRNDLRSFEQEQKDKLEWWNIYCVVPQFQYAALAIFIKRLQADFQIGAENPL